MTANTGQKLVIDAIMGGENLCVCVGRIIDESRKSN